MAISSPPTVSPDPLDLTRRHESTSMNTFALSERPPVFARGRGATLFTEDGRAYTDLTSGSCVTNLGYGHPRHIETLQAHAETGLYHVGTRVPNATRAALYAELAGLFPEPLKAIHLMSSGSEAIETAIKAAQFATGRRQVVAFQGGFHGKTYGALAVSSVKSARAPFLPLDGGVAFMPYPYALRPPLPASPEALADACLETLRRSLKSPVSGLDRPSCLLVEAVQGVGGVIVPPRGFLSGLRAICDEFDLVMIADEVWNGFGRTGAWFAYQHDGVTPDLVTVAKGLTASMPLSGVVGSPDLLQRWPAGLHTGTFQGNPLACALGVATIRAMREERVVERVEAVIAPAFERHLADLADLPHVAEVRLNGGQVAIELVEPADGITPAPSAVRAIRRVCLERGVVVYGGGAHDNCLMALPPLVIGEAEIDGALAEVAAAVRAHRA